MLSYFKKIRKTHYVVLGILLLVGISNMMFTTGNQSFNLSDDKKFAGSASCAGCHQKIYKSHSQTAHYLDSRPAAKEFIKGSFTEGRNKFIYNKWMEVVLEQKDRRFFQTAYINGTELQSEPFDIVIGSGRKGQTYLYWNDNKLYQLPVSYYTPLDNWCNSPGYSNNRIKFDRNIPAQCLECHGTYARAEIDADSLTVYDKANIIYGIDCERCHGPGADHVAFHKEHPAEKVAKYMLRTVDLGRQQKLDACALCHSGFRDPIQPAFSFITGDRLNEFSKARYTPDSVATLDVHGNQYGLLLSSKCFKMSGLDCSSCHNVHVNEANEPAIFSQRCISCHPDSKHASLNLPAAQALLLKKNCIDCHMPMLPSNAIVLNVANVEKNVPDLVRTHRVAIYPEKTAAFLEKIREKH